jgi:broad specificity phosphatase PhoE
MGVALLLIRHADAGNRKDWDGDDRLRPLSPKGERQARALVRRLQKWAPDRILSSPFVRCIQTVQPLADELGLKVTQCDELAEGMGPEALALVRSLANEPVALCSHGDVIPEVLVSLADEDRLDLGPAPRQAKGSAWILETKKGKFTKATYVPPAS